MPQMIGDYRRLKNLLYITISISDVATRNRFYCRSNLFVNAKHVLIPLGTTTVSSAEVDAPLFTTADPEVAAAVLSVSIGIIWSSVAEISICEGDAG